MGQKIVSKRRTGNSFIFKEEAIAEEYLQKRISSLLVEMDTEKRRVNNVISGLKGKKRIRIIDDFPSLGSYTADDGEEHYFTYTQSIIENEDGEVGFIAHPHVLKEGSKENLREAFRRQMVEPDSRFDLERLADDVYLIRKKAKSFEDGDRVLCRRFEGGLSVSYLVMERHSGRLLVEKHPKICPNFEDGKADPYLGWFKKECETLEKLVGEEGILQVEGIGSEKPQGIEDIIKEKKIYYDHYHLSPFFNLQPKEVLDVVLKNHQNDRARGLDSKLPDDFFSWMVQSTLKGLRSVHRRGLRHKDVKWENVFLHFNNGKLEAVLADLGTAGDDETQNERFYFSTPYAACIEPCYPYVFSVQYANCAGYRFDPEQEDDVHALSQTLLSLAGFSVKISYSTIEEGNLIKCDKDLLLKIIKKIGREEYSGEPSEYIGWKEDKRLYLGDRVQKITKEKLRESLSSDSGLTTDTLLYALASGVRFHYDDETGDISVNTDGIRYNDLFNRILKSEERDQSTNLLVKIKELQHLNRLMVRKFNGISDTYSPWVLDFIEELAAVRTERPNTSEIKIMMDNGHAVCKTEMIKIPPLSVKNEKEYDLGLDAILELEDYITIVNRRFAARFLNAVREVNKIHDKDNIYTKIEYKDGKIVLDQLLSIRDAKRYSTEDYYNHNNGHVGFAYSEPEAWFTHFQALACREAADDPEVKEIFRRSARPDLEKTSNVYSLCLSGLTAIGEYQGIASESESEFNTLRSAILPENCAAPGEVVLDLMAKQRDYVRRVIEKNKATGIFEEGLLNLLQQGTKLREERLNMEDLAKSLVKYLGQSIIK